MIYVLGSFWWRGREFGLRRLWSSGGGFGSVGVGSGWGSGVGGLGRIGASRFCNSEFLESWESDAGKFGSRVDTSFCWSGDSRSCSRGWCRIGAGRSSGCRCRLILMLLLAAKQASKTLLDLGEGIWCYSLSKVSKNLTDWWLILRACIYE